MSPDSLRPMSEQAVTIINKRGLHARASAKFVTLAGTFASKVSVSHDGVTVNGGSIMGLMMLAAGPGETIVIAAEGEDAETAVAALVGLVNARFDEDQ